jgi:hypothetical protein
MMFAPGDCVPEQRQRSYAGFVFGMRFGFASSIAFDRAEDTEPDRRGTSPYPVAKVLRPRVGLVRQKSPPIGAGPGNGQGSPQSSAEMAREEGEGA